MPSDCHALYMSTKTGADNSSRFSCRARTQTDTVTDATDHHPIPTHSLPQACVITSGKWTTTTISLHMILKLPRACDFNCYMEIEFPRSQAVMYTTLYKSHWSILSKMAQDEDVPSLIRSHSRSNSVNFDDPG